MFESTVQDIQNRMAQACERAGRDPDEVTLIAVSKTHPPESIHLMVQEGLLDFGENKVQEAKAKIPLCDGRIRWHGIGHLQTNKAKDAVQLFSMIHSVDSLRLAEELSKHASHASKHLPILLEVNVSGESSKFGMKPEDLPSLAREISQLSHLELRGLMTIPPYSNDPESSRPFFRKLVELNSSLADVFGSPLPDLSMGMSGDFEVAIEEGATYVRIGTALFGERKKSSFRATLSPED